MSIRLRLPSGIPADAGAVGVLSPGRKLVPHSNQERPEWSEGLGATADSGRASRSCLPMLSAATSGGVAAVAGAGDEAGCGAENSSECVVSVGAPALGVAGSGCAGGTGARVALFLLASSLAWSRLASGSAAWPVFARRVTFAFRFTRMYRRKSRMAMAAAPPPAAGPIAAPPPAPAVAPLAVDERSGGGGESDVPGAGAAATATVGFEVTVKPEGMRFDATDASARLGARLLCAASAVALDADSMVISRRTEAAVTLRETRLCETPAALAKLSTIADWTLAV